MKRTVFLFLLTFAITANAQDTNNSSPGKQGVQTLTLKEAINYALENKADSKKAKLQVENSEYKIQEVLSAALPQVSASGNLTNNPVIQTTVINSSDFGMPGGGSLKIGFGQKWSSTVGVSLNQNIFNQAIFTGLRAAKSTREFYQINEQLTEENVIERVATSYYNVYVQRLNLAVLDSNYVNTNRVKNIIEGQYNNGLVRKIDLNRIIVKLSNISTQRQQVINGVALQENALKFYMGMPVDTQIIIPDTEFEIMPQSLSETADVENLNQYLLLKKQEELLIYQKKAAQADYFPTLSFTAGYNYMGQGKKFPWFALPANGVYWSDFSGLGLNLRIPIFNGLGTRAKVRQADVSIRSLREDIEDTKLSLDIAYSNAKIQMENSLITINNQKENKELARQVLRNTKDNYLHGLASLNDLLDVENAYIEAENNYSSAVLGYKIAEIQIIKSKGQLKSLINN